MESVTRIPISNIKHISNIFKEYTQPSRLLQSFTNLSNTVIQTSLRGQTKFIFEILQNADDAFEDTDDEIEVSFILENNYLIVHHDGKGFDYNDVERICDYASQIEEVKATDLSKTGYKGLGFKSLFNLSDTIYIHSNGYCFRFDKTYWEDWQETPWQIIPIWCEQKELPLYRVYRHDKPVNIILKVNDVDQVEKQMEELVSQPDLLLFLQRIKNVNIKINGENHNFERISDVFGKFTKIELNVDDELISTWLTKTYRRIVPQTVQNLIQNASHFIYPEKIKTADKVQVKFAVKCDEDMKKILNIKGLLFSTLPTQLHVTLPYHINGPFILNLDRSQLHENEWNEFLINQIGSLQLCLLRDIAGIDDIKNYVINIFRREIDHPLSIFCKAFIKGFSDKSSEIGWLPSFRHTRLLKLNEAWIDKTEFFKQNFQVIDDDKIYPYLIDYELMNQNILSTEKDQISIFEYKDLFKDFEKKYYPQLTGKSYLKFISYIYEKLKSCNSQGDIIATFKKVPILKSKKKTLLTIENAILEENENVIPDFFDMCNVVDKNCLPPNNTDLIKEWFVRLGARRLAANEIIRKSILKWISEKTLHQNMTVINHIEIINHLSENIDALTVKESDKLKDGLLLLTESNNFRLAKECYFPNAVPTKVFANILPTNETISSSYVLNDLKDFFIRLGVCEKLQTVDIIRRTILTWIKNECLNSKLTVENYNSILDYLAKEYPLFNKILTAGERKELKRFQILTSDGTFQEAKFCYFDTALPKVKCLVNEFPRSNMIIKHGLSEIIMEFLLKIGVSDKIEPVEVLRKTVLKWIGENEIGKKIDINNHKDILEYIKDNKWDSSQNLKMSLTLKERENLRKFPILTKKNTFRKAEDCYWQFSSGGNQFKIPNLNFVVSDNELVSTEYDLKEYKQLFSELGVQELEFTNIYEKYSDHLNNCKSIQWFLSKLKKYWEINKYNRAEDILLNRLRQKFSSEPFLLAKDSNMYRSVDMYSLYFCSVHDIFPHIFPLLPYDNLPSDLETWLGFKNTLELDCIVKLMSAFSKKSELGQNETKLFFSTLLEQIKKKNKSDMRKYSLLLLSKENKLKPAKELYYFKEEDATCELNDVYLKRIHGMTHEETLELAELCGVNILPFDIKITHEIKEMDDTLKKFYTQRLPYIVAMEAIELNENYQITLRRLYNQVTAIQLYQCQKIIVQYPFENPVPTRLFFDNFNIYCYGKWASKRTKIHEYLKKQLDIKTDIIDIIDMDPPTDRDEWFDNRCGDIKLNYNKIVEEMKCLTDPIKRIEMDTSKSEKMVSFNNKSNTDRKERNMLEIVSSIDNGEGKFNTRSLKRHNESTLDESISESDGSISEPDEAISESDEAISESDGSISESDGSISESEEAISESEEAISESEEAISVSDEAISESDEAISESDEAISESDEATDEPDNPEELMHSSDESIFEHDDELISESDNSISSPHLIEPVEGPTQKYLNDVPDNSQKQKPMPNRSKKRSLKDDILKDELKLRLGNKTEIIKKSSRSVLHNLPPSKRRKIGGSFSNAGQTINLPLFEPQNIDEKSKVKQNTKKSDNRNYKKVSSVSSSNREEYKLNNHRMFTSIMTTSPQSGIFSGESQHDQDELQLLGEECVFSFLQDHYKSKHPNSSCTISNGCFTLSGLSCTVKITWLNELKDAGLSYDFILKKDGDTQRFIEVNSILMSNKESLNIFDLEHYWEAKTPLEQKEKFRTYIIVFEDGEYINQGNIGKISYTLYKTNVFKKFYEIS